MTIQEKASPVAHSPALDDAPSDSTAIQAGDEPVPVDPEVVRRAVRKIDWFLIPAMTLGTHSHTHPTDSTLTLSGYGFVVYDKVHLLSLTSNITQH